MAISNRERVGKGLDLLHHGLRPFMEEQFRAKLGDGYKDIVKARFDLKHQPDGDLHLDNQALLHLFLNPEVWHEMLKSVIGKAARSYAGELIDVRNRHAHNETFTSDQAERALDTIRLLLVELGATKEAEAVHEVRHELQRTVFREMARHKVRGPKLIEGKPDAGLVCWRQVVTPHQDVVSGRYVQAEFAADLHNVHHGIGGAEYTDPAEFFRRTFVTDGIRDLLIGALERITGKGGDPVVELQTNFGGGKTHAMLALYHLFSGAKSSKLPGMESILKEVGIEQAPQATRSVLVGTHLSVGETSTKEDGTKVRTLWGEMAWQLAGAEGFSIVAESDAHGTSPGAERLSDLFRLCAPCVILIDEWVAYARNTVEKRNLPSGDFEAQATFAQALTESAKGVDGVLVVASIPSSDIEVGGPNGKHALSVLKNVFERVGKTWRPATADEGFEIVRRRLFNEITDRDKFALRDAVVAAFARLYAENKADFPSGVAEGAYKRKLEAAYPLHPEVFDLLYGEWSTLDKFQRTRGVLRLLAKVIHRLWEGNDSGLLILPASLPMDDGAVKSEMTRYLDDVWEPIISEDVDGPNSLPIEIDRSNSNLGRYSACRRVARTLYMGTAPGSRGKNPGIDDRRVRLGCTQPGEFPATFGDALRRIADKAKHIHQDGNRFWISTKANLNRLAEDRANSLLQEPERLHSDLVRRIREECKPRGNRGEFAGVHPCPDSPAEVHDEPEARLVILGPEHPHRKGLNDTAGWKTARKILDQRGSSPRINRNTLVFLAADERHIGDLLQASASYMAWQSILDEHEALNLDAFQRRQASTKVTELDGTVSGRIHQSWTIVLVPSQGVGTAGEQVRPEDLVFLDEVRVQGNEPLAKKASTKLKNEGTLVSELGGTTLRHHLDTHLWKEKNHVSVGQLAEWFPRYLYLPRVVAREVIVSAVRDGLRQLNVADTFAMAAGYDGTMKRYTGLQLRAPSGAVIENSTLLVKADVAKRQIEEDQKPKCPACGAKEPEWNPAEVKCSACGHERPKPLVSKCPKCEATVPAWNPVAGRCSKCGYKREVVKASCPTCGAAPPVFVPATGNCTNCEPPLAEKPDLFVGSVKLDHTRVGRDAGRIAEEVLQHLSTLPGAKVVVHLEVQVNIPGGVDEDVVRSVTENCNTLKFDTAGFEKE
jgi:uncharacterized protein